MKNNCLSFWLQDLLIFDICAQIFISNLIDKLKTKLGSDFIKFNEYDIYTISYGLKKSKNKRKYFDFKIVFSEKNTSDLIDDIDKKWPWKW